MNARYFYLDADGQSVHGPFGLQDIWALRDRRILTADSLICRAGTEDWRALATYPEMLVAQAAVPTQSVTPPPIPVRARPAGGKSLSAADGCGLGCAGLVLLFFLTALVDKCKGPSPSAPTATQTSSVSSWDDGYNQGYPIGKTWGRAGRTIPAEEQLHADSLRACRAKVSPPDEDQWVRGFESGFGVGYKEATKPAF